MSSINRQELDHKLAKSRDRKKQGGGLSNVYRAEKAAEALRVFAAGDYPESEPAQDILPDLLSNLMHMCRLNGLDFDKALASARMNYEHEI